VPVFAADVSTLSLAQLLTSSYLVKKNRGRKTNKDGSAPTALTTANNKSVTHKKQTIFTSTGDVKVM
jgi:hypothetical protein